MKVADVKKKTGVESAMIVGNKHQEDDIIRENIPMLLYTRFVMSAGIGF